MLFPVAMYFLTSAMVADGLRIVYLLYNIVIALALLQRPKSNPGKQIWQILLLMLTEDEQTYHMIRPDWQDSVDREEMP